MTFSNHKKKKKNAINNKNKVGTFTRLLFLMEPYKFQVLMASICVLIINGTALIKPYILKITIDDFLVSHKSQSGIYSIFGMAISYLAVVVISSFLQVVQVMIINKAGQGIVKNLRGEVFKTIQLLPLSYIDKVSSGRLITRASNDVEALSEMYTDVLINLFKDLFLIVGIVYTMFMMNIKLTLISLSVIPIMAGIIIFLKAKIRQNFIKMKKITGKINGFMAESLLGMKVIQIFHGEEIKKKQFKKLNKEYYDASLIQMMLNAVLRPSADIFQTLAIAILICYSMSRIDNGVLSIGVIYAFTTYIKQFFEPIADLAENYTTIQSALVSADRIFEILDEKDNIENLDEGINIDRINGDIEFRHVWFSYDDENWILKDVSFVVSKGQMCAFVGETGAGKSTIISLISGFYKVQRGEILIDGININDIRKRSLRRNVSVVLQDVFLFSGTIKDNIVLNDDIEEDKLNQSIDVSNVKYIIEKYDDKLDHEVMERGNTFSSGEKQLISFARAVSHNPAIFVLDEATSNIDTETEVMIQDALSKVTKGITTLVIAHRLSTIKNADNIIVLKNGEIVEMGNHESLMEQGGYYKNLVKMS